jgi:hypothetical protein
MLIEPDMDIFGLQKKVWTGYSQEKVLKLILTDLSNILLERRTTSGQEKFNRKLDEPDFRLSTR